MGPLDKLRAAFYSARPRIVSSLFLCEVKHVFLGYPSLREQFRALSALPSVNCFAYMILFWGSSARPPLDSLPPYPPLRPVYM